MYVECTIFGLGVRVNRRLAALASLPVARQIDVCIVFGSLPVGSQHAVGSEVEEFYVSPYRDENCKPTVRVARLCSSGAIRMFYADGTIFVINEQATQVWAVTPPDQIVEDTAAYLLGPIMGTILRMRGIMCLHGSAVAINDRAIALVGVSGAGKSTTAAAFARLGFPVLSDDVLSLTDKGSNFLVRPAYPRVRLWPESVAGLFGSVDKLPRITPGWNKRFLGLNAPGYRFQGEPLELAAIYFLGTRTSACNGKPVVEAMRPTEAVMALVSDSYASNYVYQSLRAQEFEVLSRLVQSVPLRRVAASNDFSRINEFCNAIVQDNETLRDTVVSESA